MNAVLLGRVERGRGKPSPLFEQVRSKLRLFVDGQPTRGLVAFDSWAGWVEVLQRDDAGKPVMLAGVLQTVRLHGAVRVVVQGASPAEMGELVRRGLALA